MKLYKRGEIWWFKLQFKGKPYRQSTRSKNQRAAQQIMSTFHAALIKGEVGITERRPAPLLTDAMRDFLAWSTQVHRSKPKTAERHQYSSRPLLLFFRNPPLDAITPDLVEDYKLQRSFSKRRDGKRLAPATVNRELACLRAMFNHAIKKHPNLRNPISKLTGVSLLAENNQQERVLTYAEETAYLIKASPVLWDVASMMLETGMRPEEVFVLRAHQINLEQNYLRVLEGKTKAARRRIELTHVSAEILKRLIAAAPVGYLFPNERDEARPLPGIQSPHARALRESKVPHFRPYDLRHTWATRAAEAGVDLITLAAMMGHSRIQMVLRYAHPSQNHQTGAMTKVVEHKAAQRARERAKDELPEQRAAASGMHVVPKLA